MKDNILSGKEISAAVKEKLKLKTENLKKQGINPGLAVIIVGEDPASKVYVNNKKKTAESLGIYSEIYELPENTEQSELLKLVEALNKRDDINGILCQLPLPKHLNEKEVINKIDKNKDVDAFHPENVGKIMLGEPLFLPCTPAGVMEMLKYKNINIQGKHCVVVGRSNIVGKPMAMLLLKENGTVTVCHSKTENLKKICKSADILVAAVGRPLFITKDMVKKGAVIIDVGINRLKDGKLCGDVDFEKVCKKAEYITPVPGGVGVMTVTMLMQNTLKAAELQFNEKINEKKLKETPKAKIKTEIKAKTESAKKAIKKAVTSAAKKQKTEAEKIKAKAKALASTKEKIKDKAKDKAKDKEKEKVEEIKTENQTESKNENS